MEQELDLNTSCIAQYIRDNKQQFYNMSAKEFYIRETTEYPDIFILINNYDMLKPFANEWWEHEKILKEKFQRGCIGIGAADVFNERKRKFGWKLINL